MRKHGVSNAYEQLKDLTRGRGGIDQASMQTFIRSLSLPQHEIDALLLLAPSTYTGLAAALAQAIKSE